MSNFKRTKTNAPPESAATGGHGILKRCLSLYLACIFLLFMIIVASLYGAKKSALQGRQAQYEAELSAIVQAVDAELAATCASVMQFTNDVNLLGYTAKTERDLTQEAEISYYIYLSTQSYKNVERYYVYYPSTDVILASFSGARFSQYSPFHDTLNLYTSQGLPLHTFECNNRYGAIFSYDSRYFLSYEIFPKTDAPLGIVFAQLNLPEILSALPEALQTSANTLYILDTDGNSIYENRSKRLQSGAETEMISEARPMITYQSQSTLFGWTYYYSCPVFTFWDALRAALASALPVALALAAISMLLHRFFDAQVGQPMAQLLSVAPPAEGTDGSLSSLSQRFQALQLQNRELSAVFERMKPEITRQFLSQLLQGSSLNLSEMQTLMVDLGLNYQFGDRIILELLAFSGTPGELRNAHALLPMIMQKAKCRADRFRIHRIHDAQALIFILVGQEEPILDINREYTELLRASFAGIHIPLPTVQNCICYSLLDVHTAYRHMLDRLLPCDEQPDGGDPFMASVISMEDCLNAAIEQIKDQETDRAFTTICSHLDAYCAENGNIIHNVQLTNWLTEMLVHFSVSESNLEALGIQELLTKQTPYTRDERNALIQNVITTCAACHEKAQNRYVLAAKKVVSELYSDPSLSLIVVAEKIGIHPNYLSKLFKTCLNLNFIDYLRNYRISISKDALKNSSLPVNEVATGAGFSSPQTFIRVFKACVGCTPGQYRKQMTLGQEEESI